MTRRRFGAILLVVVLLLGGSGAGLAGAYEGSSLFDNIAPKSDVRGMSADYPLNRYGLDYHVSAGVKSSSVPTSVGGAILDYGNVDVPTGVDADGIPFYVAHVIADGIYWLHRLISSFVLILLQFAWTLHLIEAVIDPVLDAQRDLYTLFGGDLFTAVICLVGVWAIFRVFRGRLASTAGQLFVSAACILVAMFILTQSHWAIPQVANSVIGLSAALPGAIAEDGDATSSQDAAVNAIFKVQIRDTYRILNFGGITLCVDKDGKPVKPFSQDCDDSRKISTNKYTDGFLKAGEPNGPGRTLWYNAIREGKKPSKEQIDQAGLKADAFDDIALTAADKPAVDVQQQQMAIERVGVAGLIFLTGLGINVLVGGLAVLMLTTAVTVLLWLLFASVMLLIGAIPNAGHRVFREWITRIGFGLLKPVLYSLLLTACLAIVQSLGKAGADLNWLMAQALACAFAWGIVLQKDDIYRWLETAIGGGVVGHGRSVADLYYKTKMLQAPAGVVTGAARRLDRAVRGDEHEPGAGRRLYGATSRGARRGSGAVKDGVDAYAASAFTPEDMVTAGGVRHRAAEQLRQEHRMNQNKLKRENARRARLAELNSREQLAHSGEPGTEEFALTPKDKAERARLERQVMAKADYEGLRDTVTTIERREKDGVPFTEEEVAKRSAKLQAQYAETNGASEDPASLADRARQWATLDFDRLLGPGEGDGASATNGGARRRKGEAARAERANREASDPKSAAEVAAARAETARKRAARDNAGKTPAPDSPKPSPPTPSPKPKE